MEFEELLLEEIIAIVKEAKDENFMRIDLKKLLKERLGEYHEKINEEWEGVLDSESYDAGYENGFNSGYEQALEDIEDKMDDIRIEKRRNR